MTSTTPTPLHPVATTQAGEPKPPALPQSLINLIGEYGMARTDGINELDRLARWEELIAGIKDYAIATIEMQASHSAAGIVMLYNEGGSGERKNIEVAGSLGSNLADQLAPGTLVYLHPSHSAAADAVPVAQDTLTEIIGCFQAAEIEGLYDALGETTDLRLKDLVERRIMFAYHAALRAIPTTAPAATTPAASEKVRSPTYSELEALYEGQCKCTDDWADKYNAIVNKTADATLQARIEELQGDLINVNAKLIEANSVIFAAQVAANKPAAVVLPKWIDAMKGADPTMDGVIEWIEANITPAAASGD